jgi:hypothetical protein
VERAAPRMVNRLRGKGIVKLFAGYRSVQSRTVYFLQACFRLTILLRRSFAIDSDGRLYHWGLRAASVPELHPFFNAKQADGEPIRVVQIASCSVRDERADFFGPNFVVAVLTDTGLIYWVGGLQKDETPEIFSAADRVFGVEIAMTSASLAILDKDGQVWTCGQNKYFELGSGGTVDLKLNVNDATSRTLREKMPSVITQVQLSRRHTKISSIRATFNQYLALSTDGVVFHWGAGACIPSPLLETQKTSISKIETTSYTAFLMIGPAPIMLAADDSADLLEREQRRVLESAQRLSRTEDGILVKKTESPTTITVDWMRREYRKPRQDRILFVHPGCDRSDLADLFAAESPLNEYSNSGTLIFSTSGAGWGLWENKRPAVPPGTYELLFVSHDADGHDQIHARSAPFTLIRDLSKINIQYPTKVLPQEKFIMSWKSCFEMLYAAILIFKVPENQMHAMHIASPDVEICEQTLHMEGEYRVRVGRCWDSETKEFADEFDFDFPTISVRAPRLEFDDLRFELSPGPYRVRQPIQVKWDIKPEARSVWKGTEYFGFYTLNDPNPYPMPMGGIVMMRFADHADKIFPPEKPGTWNLRFQVVTTGLVVIHEMPIEVLPEKPAEPEPVVVTAPQPLAAALPAGLPTIVVPSYSSWSDFFKACEIPDMFCNIYCTVMSAQNVDAKLIPSLEAPIIEKMGIATPAHQLMIMNKVREIRAAEMKQFIAQYLTGLAGTGAIQQPLAQILDGLQKN